MPPRVHSRWPRAARSSSGHSFHHSRPRNSWSSAASRSGSGNSLGTRLTYPLLTNGPSCTIPQRRGSRNSSRWIPSRATALSVIPSEYALRVPLPYISNRPTTPVSPTYAPFPGLTAAASSGWTVSPYAISRCSAPRQAGKGSHWWMSLTNAPPRWAPGFCGPGLPCRHWTLTKSNPATT